jgi:hypothetical protein
MARRYVRDKRGRFAPKGYSGQTSGTGSRLTGKAGKTRKEGGAKAKGPAQSGVIKPGKGKPKPASSIKATGNLPKPPKQNSIARTGGKFGPKNTIKPGPKSPRTKMNKAIDGIIAKGKELKGAKEKLQDLKGQVDALKGKMIARDKARAKKAFDKPSVTDKRSRDYLGRLTKEGKRQDPSTGGKKKRKKRK